MKKKQKKSQQQRESEKSPPARIALKIEEKAKNLADPSPSSIFISTRRARLFENFTRARSALE
jgi:hypothetical protein